MRFLVRPDKASAAAYVIASVVSVYLQLFAGLVIVAQLASLPLLRTDWCRHILAIAAMAVAIALLCVPLAVVQLQEMFDLR
jgi:hypothetical protein